MDHLSSMKRKNVVLVYNLLLEMLDANTSSSQQSSSPGSDSYSEQFQYPGQDHAPAPPAKAPPLQSSPPFQSLLVAHMDDE